MLWKVTRTDGEEIFVVSTDTADFGHIVQMTRVDGKSTQATRQATESVERMTLVILDRNTR